MFFQRMYMVIIKYTLNSHEISEIPNMFANEESLSFQLIKGFVVSYHEFCLIVITRAVTFSLLFSWNSRNKSP